MKKTPLSGYRSLSAKELTELAETRKAEDEKEADEKKAAEKKAEETKAAEKKAEEKKADEKRAEEKKADEKEKGKETERNQEKALDTDDLPWIKSKSFHVLIDTSAILPSRPGAEFLSDLRVLKKGSKVVHLRPTDGQFVFVGTHRFHLLLLVRSKKRKFQVWLRDPSDEETYIAMARHVDAVEAAPVSSKYSMESTRLQVGILFSFSLIVIVIRLFCVDTFALARPEG